MIIDLSVLRALEREQNVAFDDLIQIVEQAIVTAYLRHAGLGEAQRDLVQISLDRSSGLVEIAVAQTDEEGEILGYLPDTSEDFGRVAAGAAKQVIARRMRSFTDDTVFARFREKVGKVLPGVVSQSNSGNLVKVSLGDEVEALLRPEEQVPNESYRHGQRLKVYVLDVVAGTRGTSVYVSRTHPGLIRGLFAHEIPEIADGRVEIVSVAREPGHRTKIAVRSKDETVNAKGACVGEYGRRVRAVMSEIGEEKIDIIGYSDDFRQYVINALSPATAVDAFVISPKDKAVRVYVSKEEHSLAIGKEGQNARLAARLTGARIDIRLDIDE